jgi:hypothetical protein
LNEKGRKKEKGIQSTYRKNERKERSIGGREKHERMNEKEKREGK